MAGALNIPNAISLARLVLVPVFLWLRLRGEPEWALGVFVIASASDLLDGFLARVLNQRSRLGGVIDPVADKLLVVTALATLVAEGTLPGWLLAVLLIRDVPMAIGAWVVRRKRLAIPTMPSRVGKYATFSTVVAIVLGLGVESPHAPHTVEGYTVAVAIVAGLCVALSCLQYWVRFGYLFFVPGRSPPSPGRESRTHG
ncbi:MAG: CDP-alcohol phosphatidyltransferase family protein [Myxococcaceae bacterium]|nr:CDP-alcohol phosphatidyltransferase family protein [Myxococcaceae bacterium]